MNRREQFDKAVQALAYDTAFMDALFEYDADTAFMDALFEYDTDSAAARVADRVHLARVILTRVDDLKLLVWTSDRKETA